MRGDSSFNPLACDIVEGPAGPGMDGSLAGEALPAPNRDVDVFGIELDQARSPSGLLCCNPDGARAAKRV
jgi:hypothetical protein